MLKKSCFVAMQDLCFPMEKSLVVWELFSDLGAREQIWSRGQKPILARAVNKFVVRLSLSLSGLPLALPCLTSLGLDF